MPRSTLHELLANRDWLLADGATGTNYFAMGLQSGDAPELWNVSYPERVASLHRSFVDAGADIILTNSFGGSSYRLKLHQAQGRVAELNFAAASIARSEADRADRPVIVAGSIGPTGEILKPVGALEPGAAEEAFAVQALALAEGGADVIWLETMSSKEELQSAGAGARRADLPVVATMTFDTNGSTMMGFSPQELVELYRETVPRLTAYGANCGVGAADLIGAMIAMRNRADSGDILVAKSNCGIPEFTDGKIQYSGTPDLMSDYARLARDAGARIIGGCCGTTPEHLTAMRKALYDHRPGRIPKLDDVVNLLGPVTAGTRACCTGRPLGSDQSDRPKRGRRRTR
jgi:5-methyltetrahydrofolate--homocysteine methyltransferase